MSATGTCAKDGVRVFRLLIGAAIGYVLGSRAGRERYEQIKRWSARVADHPAVQGAAGFVRAKVTDALPGNHHS
jgi:hypothetical protein